MIRLKKIIEYGLYLLVFLLPLQTRYIWPREIGGVFWEYGSYSLYIFDLFFLLIFSLFLFDILRNKSFLGAKIKNYWWIIAFLELFVFISCFLAINSSLAFFTYGRFLIGMGVFCLIVCVKYDRKYLELIFLSAVFFQGTLGIWQFLSQGTFANRWLGLAQHVPSDLGASVVEVDGIRWLRAYGGLDHPNMLGALMFAGIIFLIFGKFGRSQKNKLEIVVEMLFGVIFSLALVFSFSRAAWLALLIGLVVSLILANVKKDLVLQRRVLSFVVFLSLFGAVLFYFYAPIFETRMKSQGRIEEKSNNERIEYISRSRDIIGDNLFFGVGAGNYSNKLAQSDDYSQAAYIYQPVHNVFALVWAEIGIFGLLAFLTLLFYVGFSGGIVVLNIVFIISLGFIFMVDHWWWSLHFGVMLFWFICGYLLKFDLNVCGEVEKNKNLKK